MSQVGAITRTMSRSARCAIALLVVTLSVAECWAAGSVEPRIEAIRIGFDGRYKLGRWTMLDVALVGGAHPATAKITVTVTDGDDVPCRYHLLDDRPVQLVPGRTTNVQLPVRIGRDGRGLTVRVDTALGEGVERTFLAGAGADELPWALDERERLYVVIGQSLGLGRSANNDVNVPAVAEAAIDDVGRLPTRWLGYDAADAVIIASSRPEILDRLVAPHTREYEALVEWMELGGRLILAAGSEADRIIRPRIAERVAGIEQLKRVGALERFAGRKKHVPLTFRGEPNSLSVARLENPLGVVLVEEGNLPLIVDSAQRFGTLSFLTFALDRPPIADWPGRLPLLQRLLDEPLQPLDSVSASLRVNNLGYSDLAGQFRGALDRFAGVTVVPFWIVGASVLGYILLIGPVDFWLVKRVLKRPELTWVTFPTIVLVVSLAAYAAASWAKGNIIWVNHVELVDVDNQTGALRGTSWINIFSPRTATYELNLKTTHQPAKAIFTWLGLPGRGWGGMQARTTGTRLFERPYEVAPDLGTLNGVPIDVWSTKSFLARWQATGDVRLIDTEQLIAQPGQPLEGSLTSQLDLDDALLVYDRWAWPLGHVQHGATITIDTRSRRDLQTAVKEVHVTRDAHGNAVGFQAQTFDPAGTDTWSILRQMMFYRAAGGAAYTHLTNDYQSFLDLSELLKLKRAMLLGRATGDNRASELLNRSAPLSGQLNYQCYYRIVLPIGSAP